MDAIVTAGGTPEPDDPLYKYTQGKPKALLDIRGKTMIQWVLNALEQAKTVERVVIIGLPSDSGVSCSKCVVVLPSQGGIVENILVGAQSLTQNNQSAQHVLVVASDIPAITPEAVDWIVNAARETDPDICYTMITRRDLEARYPGAKHPFPFEGTRLRDIDYVGGQMHAIRTRAIAENQELWKRLMKSRRSLLRRISAIIDYLGFSVLISVAFGTISSDQVVKRIAERTGLVIKPVVCPHVEVAMDADRPNQFEMLRKDLEQRLTP